MPSGAITYPAAVFGYPANTPAAGGTGLINYFVTSAAVSQGAAVGLDAAGTVSPITTAVAVGPAARWPCVARPVRPR